MPALYIVMDLPEIADEIIALSVTGTAIVCAGYVVYTTGEIPDYLSMGFGVVLSYYFTKKVIAKS